MCSLVNLTSVFGYVADWQSKTVIHKICSLFTSSSKKVYFFKFQIGNIIYQIGKLLCSPNWELYLYSFGINAFFLMKQRRGYWVNASSFY